MALKDWLPFLGRGEASTGANPVRASADYQAGDGGVIWDPSNPEHAQYLRNGAGSGGFNADTAMKIATVYRCIHILAGVPGNMPFELMRRVDEKRREPAVGHPARDLVATRPNHWQTPQEFKRMLTAHVALRGNGYALKVSGVGGIQALWPIHPDRIRAVQGADMSLVYQYTSATGATTTLPQKDVLHIRGLTFDGVTGIGALSYAREIMNMASQGQRAASKMWKQGAMAGGVVEHPGQLSEEAYDRLKQGLADRNAGTENASKWMILEEGMKAGSVAITAADMQFLESRQFDQRQIAMFFGVPPHMIGDTEKSTSWGSGIEQQTTGFIAYTEEDYLTAWEECCRRDLLTPRDGELYFRFNRAALVRGDIKTRWEAHTRALQWGVASPNEIRALEDMNPREGGDVFYDPPNTAGGNSDPAASKDQPNDPAAAASA